jgi:hypothetical protein
MIPSTCEARNSTDQEKRPHLRLHSETDGACDEIGHSREKSDQISPASLKSDAAPGVVRRPLYSVDIIKLPAFQFYPADWRKDAGVQALTFHDRGVWFEILCLMHESERRGVLLLAGAAMPEEALARILGLDVERLTTTLTTLLTYGVASRDESTGALMSRRMVRDNELARDAGRLAKRAVIPLYLRDWLTTGLTVTQALGLNKTKPLHLHLHFCPLPPPAGEWSYHDLGRGETATSYLLSSSSSGPLTPKKRTNRLPQKRSRNTCRLRSLSRRC